MCTSPRATGPGSNPRNRTTRRPARHAPISATTPRSVSAQGERHQDLIFHNILGGSFTIGTTLRRFFDLQGDDVNLTFPANVNRQGIRSQTYVKMHRLSNADDMLGR